MRSRTLVPALLLLAAPMAAQDFRGTITMRTVEATSDTPLEMRFHFGPDNKMAMTMRPTSGPAANAEMRMVVNQSTRTITSFIAAPGAPGGGKGFKMVQQMPDDAETEAAAGDIQVRKLGTSQTVAGHKCDDYEITANNETGRICATDSLGRFMMLQGGGPMSGRGSSPAWARAFGNKPMFPLKVTSPDGKTSVEVVAIERGTPDAAYFDENTPGYMSMPGMPSGRRN